MFTSESLEPATSRKTRIPQDSEYMRLIWARMKIVAEPSSAVPLATILKNRPLFEGKRVGVIVTGGNVDLDRLPWQS